MSDLSKYIPELLRLVRVVYPDWTDFSNPQFVADEIKYKRDASDFAREQLDRDVLWSLIEQGDTDGFIARLKAVAGKTNLLFMGVPSAGDLALINQPDSDLDAICRMVFDLLHGNGDAADRLGTFCDLIAANKLPQKWTFPTYYLFLLYPENEVFVKPGRTQWLSRFTDGAIPYNDAPSGMGYAAIREGFHALRDALQSQMTSPQSQSWLPDAQPRLNISSTSSDMIAIQSFVYVAHKATGESDVFAAAVARLRRSLDLLTKDDKLSDIQSKRDEVYDRYGLPDGIFAPHNLSKLEAGDYKGFLPLWKDLYNGAQADKATKDIDALRRALSILVDVSRPLLERFREVTKVNGIGPATATAILHVVYPDKYGVWYEKSKKGLRELGIFPSFPARATEGEKYVAANEVLLQLATELGLDLWTLDTLWERLSNTDEKVNPLPPPPPPIIAKEFKGFTPDAFAFMGELAANNNKAWMDANRERWHKSVLEPMRALFTDLGPHVKHFFDPYLLPDALEITPTAHKVLARINKNWSATPNSKYHEYYWGAFYRQRLSRQTDAQLFINILPDHLRFGFFVGEQATQPRNRLRERIVADREQFYDLITGLGLTGGYDFIRTNPDGRQNMIPIRTIEVLSTWVENGSFDVLMPMTPQEVVAAGPNLADMILESFRRIFPIYLWAVIGDDDDYKTIVADYLESEFPDPIDPDPPPTSYTFTDFTRDTHLTDDRAKELWAMLKDKQQAIFFGPPGTGKTWVARRLARLLTGLADPPPERLTVVQFHAAYGYEEFIEGIRPRSERGEDGRALIDYPVRPGAFVRFCREAERVNGPCVFIIDEINRGNIPRIFGELMYLLEYRQKEDSIPLPYSGDRFRIPPNVYVIGTMNTADRSIALVDLALRRRFYFAEFAADPALFDSWLKANPPAVPWLGTLYRALAERGIDDPAYAIGPSVFMRPGLDAEAISNIWKWSVMPYLREYHIDRPEAVRPWEWDSSELRELRAQDHNGEPADGNDG